MDHPDFIVSSLMENSIGQEEVKSSYVGWVCSCFYSPFLMLLLLFTDLDIDGVPKQFYKTYALEEKSD